VLREIVRGYSISNNYKMAFFAITNACNNRCRFCGIWKDKPVFVNLKDAKQ
jgi:MoaA/NifB/PqqE/SkfB family radical SAM enzyme